MSRMETSLVARDTRSLRLCACFARPGVYNLGSLTVLARPHSTGTLDDTAVRFVSQKVAGPFLVVVSGDKPVT